MNSHMTKREIDLIDIWRIALKKKWVIISIILSCVAIAGIYSLTKTPVYRAKTTLMIEEPSSGMLNLQDLFDKSGYVNQNFGTYFNTQLKLLTSRSLAERVVARMELTSRREVMDLGKKKGGALTSLKDFFTLRWLLPSSGLAEDEWDAESMENPESLFAHHILQSLKVVPVEETRLVDVHLDSKDPLFAADVVNALADEFINYSVDMRYEATQQASEFLVEQIADLRVELNAKEKELQQYGEEKKLLFLKEKENTVVTKFADFSSAYTQAQVDRINKEAAYKELKELRVGALPPFISDPVIQKLKQDYSQAKSDYDQKSRLFKSGYPLLKELSGRLASIRGELQREISYAVTRAEQAYSEASKKEESFRELLEGQRVDVVRTNNDAILYNSLNIEVENMRTLLNTLVSRQNETLVTARLQGLKTSNIKVIDRALVPKKAVAPNPSRNLILALMLGLIFGFATAFMVEYLDNSIKDPEEAEHLVGLPSLGVIPYVGPNGFSRRSGYYSSYHSYGGENEEGKKTKDEVKEIELINHFFPNLSVAEDYRTVRTSILFSQADNPPRVVTVTSVFPQEGKSSTVANLAVSFSQLRKRVLLIDADLRRPRLHTIYNVKNSKGLSSYLTGRTSLEEAIHLTSIKNLWLIPSGPNPPNPAELLDSNAMKELTRLALTRFDLVLIDSPPVMAVIDPVILGQVSDSLVMVLRPGKTTRKALVKAVEELKKSSAQIIGIIYNDVKPVRGGSYYTPSYLSYMDEYYEAKP
jgi:succinoglycan biosynthesis transport protein ExoP